MRDMPKEAIDFVEQARLDAKSAEEDMPNTFSMKVAFFLAVICRWNNVFSAKIPPPSFNDPLYSLQFHLNEKYGVTMNIHKAWNKGLTGKGITICISDPAGVATNHDDLASKFIPEGSFDYATNTADISPDKTAIYNGLYAHGTSMAGLALAKANNGKCIVGVAFDAKFSGIKLGMGDLLAPMNENWAEENKTENERFAHVMQYAHHINDIYSCSWGTISMFSDNIGYMSELIEAAMKNATEKGRDGKGSIYLFSAGNGGPFNGSCAFNEFLTSIYTIGISVVTGKNIKSRQDEPCSAIHAVTYARDTSLGLKYPDDRMPSCALKNRCLENTGASSGATAVAAGIMALVLEANPNLVWRDVQHLIARSSCSKFSSVQWKTNKVGIRYNDYFGFGLLDADALTTNAKNWTNVGSQLECTFKFPNTPRPIDGVATITEFVDLSSWPSFCGGEGQRINFLEHVIVQLSLNFTHRRKIQIEVESPGGTKSVILRAGRMWDRKQEIRNLSTMSLQFWGENPRGRWRVWLRNVEPDPKHNGTLYDWSLKLYGTVSDPLSGNTIVASQIRINQTSTASPPTTENSSTSHFEQTTPTSLFTRSTSLLNSTDPCINKNSKLCGSASTKAPALLVSVMMIMMIHLSLGNFI
ncbi:proprotein convertase subtilisin/kexin type 6-like isoform X2 [Rhopilema esculentum]|uniref:proprotein convertase subtilisin/kexin type 6-like isoform X2 n=1 Tax=Rhopilema esculentum TaxID=499914 RepID=UPI0031D9D555